MANNKKSTKIIPLVVAIVMTTMTIAYLNTGSLLSIASAQSKPDNVLGTIASIQNGKDGKPAWVTSGIVDFKALNSNSPTFNATFNMFMLDGSAAHKHTITDFKMTGSPNTNGNTTIYNGTATVSLKAGPAKDVPISIKLMGDSALSIWVDPSKTENHFGNTAIYGAQHRIA
ncbi:MAG TPA: hypothetical protein VJ729_00735 [Nitrososphaeraceae archaeon]|nr:hypothetical protein [Nitrososphaeraceae archaeon]